VADYVLASYGTGAIMAVPAHDTRDFEFAKVFDLPIVPVVDPGEEAGPIRDDLLAGRAAFVADGTAINSGRFTGLSTAEFKHAITEDLANKGLGRSAVNYRLRDWLFSRQHFWGEPFPILHELDERGRPTGLVRALTPDELPLDLPETMQFDAHHDTPEPPLEKAPAEWLYVTLDGKRYKRETNTMPQWAGSCWYYLRFLDPKNDRALVDPQVEKAWMPVDLYVGGAEHAVLHLLYARFWHKVLYDRGYVSTPEPFMKLVNQGMILGEMEFTGYQDASGRWISAEKRGQNYSSAAARMEPSPEPAAPPPTTKNSSDPFFPVKLSPSDVQKQGEVFVLKADPRVRVDSRAYKMSKSRGNVVNPDQVVADYGADSLRLYEMFMGPLEAVKPWSMEGVSGVRGFLDRFWRMIVDEQAESIRLHPAVQDAEPTRQQNRVLHKTIQAVTRDIGQLSFNTAIARMMEATNFFLKEDVRPRVIMERLVLLLAPFAPHIAEELWQTLGHGKTLAYEPWPQFDEALVQEDTIEIPVQVSGKLRAVIQVPADADRTVLEETARAHPKIAGLLSGKTVQRVIVVPGRMVNFVVH
jgi:leucyl-tRNA synthetase